MNNYICNAYLKIFHVTAMNQRKLLISFIFILSNLTVCYNSLAQRTITSSNKLGGKDFGTIFKYELDAQTLEVMHQFEGIPGANPYFTNFCESGGKIYGTTSAGGKFELGTIFSFDTASKTFERLFDFDGTNTGSNPRGGLMLASNGKLYGMAQQGGANNFGVVYEFDINSKTITNYMALDGGNLGGNPSGRFTEAGNGKLYAMTYQGGSNNEGTIIEYDIANDTIKKIFDFDGNTNGRNPFGSFLALSNGNLMGVTYQGGIYNFGILFELNPSNAALNVIHDFNGSVTGSNPYSTPSIGPNGNLFTMTYLGGANNFGTLVEYDFVNDTVIKHIDFNSSQNGRNPFGDLITINSELYGMTPFGGSRNSGVIFKYDPSGKTFTKLHDVQGGENGRIPFGSLFHASNDKLYSCTNQGGISNSGILFSYDLNVQQFNIEIHFNYAENGAYPMGRMHLASDYKLYGLSSEGGLFNDGVIFEIDPVDGQFKKLLDLQDSSTGSHPNGSFISLNDSILICMIPEGGTFGFGTMLQYNINTGIAVKTHNFNMVGNKPCGELTLAGDGKYYGLTSFGGANDLGCIFKYDQNLNTLSLLHSFHDTDGLTPFGSLELAKDGNLYGLCRDGGNLFYGTVFKYDLINSEFEKIIDLDGTQTGSYPQGGLMLADNGLLYGMTQSGGSNNLGTIISLDPSTKTVKKVHDQTDAYSAGDLIQSKNGNLLGLGIELQSLNSGNIFSYNLADSTLSILHDFELNEGKFPFGTLTEYCLPSFQTVDLATCDSFISPSGRYIWKTDGTYIDTIEAFNTCDSIITFNINILQKSYSTIDVSRCSSYTSPDFKLYLNSGTYTATIPNAEGCDSIITIHLQINNSDTSYEVNSCDSFIAPDGIIYRQSGNISATIPNHLGCDSFILINLHINSSDTTYSAVACRKFIAPDGTTYTSSGLITSTIPNHKNCDSTININLTVTHIDKQVTQTDTILSAVESGAGYQWLDCNNNFNPIPLATNQTFIAKKSGSYAVEITKDDCSDTSVCYNVNRVGIKSIWAERINISPNPFTGPIQIDLPEMSSHVKISIYDINGRIVFETAIELAQTLSIQTDLSPGIYQMKIENGEETAVFRLIRQ